MSTYTIPADTHRSRADKLLATAFPEHSRTAFQRALDAGLVTRNGKTLDRSTDVFGGEVIEFSFPENRPSEVKAVDIPLNVIFEDEHLMAINKASGMIVHPGAGTGDDTLVHALLAHCEGSLSGIGGVERPGIVHRLDRDTSGVMLVAKTDASHRGLSAQFAARTTHKQYLALVDGVPPLLSGSMRKPIGRNPTQRHKMAIIEGPNGRDAHTDWERVEAFGGNLAALMRCTIHTGRTHQIRVHLKALGHILLGDFIYGWKPSPRLPVQPERVMLHAEHLVVTHPITGETLDLRAPLPKDFDTLLKKLRHETTPTVTTSIKRGLRSPLNDVPSHVVPLVQPVAIPKPSSQRARPVAVVAPVKTKLVKKPAKVAAKPAVKAVVKAKSAKVVAKSAAKAKPVKSAKPASKIKAAKVVKATKSKKKPATKKAAKVVKAAPKKKR